MAGTNPYSQLTGVLSLYVAVYGTPEPDVAATPPAAWIDIGCTDGDQTEEHGVTDLTKFYDNCHIGPVSAVLSQQDPTFGFTLVSLTLENIARVIRTAGVVSTPTATTKRLPIKRSFYPTEYALLAKSAVDSAYGALPGQLYIPRGVFDMKFSVVRSKTARAGFATMFHALEDDAQVEMDRLGWKTMATA
jgi:hypothetical protein